jgi:hypothetical protein
MRSRHRRSTDPLTEVEGPVWPGSDLYRLLELAARSIARRERVEAPDGTPCESNKNDGRPQSETGHADVPTSRRR